MEVTARLGSRRRGTKAEGDIAKAVAAPPRRSGGHKREVVRFTPAATFRDRFVESFHCERGAPKLNGEATDRNGCRFISADRHSRKDATVNNKQKRILSILIFSFCRSVPYLEMVCSHSFISYSNLAASPGLHVRDGATQCDATRGCSRGVFSLSYWWVRHTLFGSCTSFLRLGSLPLRWSSNTYFLSECVSSVLLFPAVCSWGGGVREEKLFEQKHRMASVG